MQNIYYASNIMKRIHMKKIIMMEWLYKRSKISMRKKNLAERKINFALIYIYPWTFLLRFVLQIMEKIAKKLNTIENQNTIV